MFSPKGKKGSGHGVLLRQLYGVRDQTKIQGPHNVVNLIRIKNLMGTSPWPPLTLPKGFSLWMRMNQKYKVL